jgi:DNA-binding NtrC family response regulator
MSAQRVLLVDDDLEGRAALSAFVEKSGYQTAQASDGEQALALLDSFHPGVVVSDLRMPRLDGLGLLRRARAGGYQGPFILLTGHGSVEVAVEAMRFGAEDVLLKPPDPAATLSCIEKALEREPQRALARPRNVARGGVEFPEIIGESESMRAVLDIVRQSAGTKATVLILGESGTGKELIAQALHELSPRRHKPFIKLNCAALTDSLLENELFGHERGSFTGAITRSPGRFERAHEGSLFLDEAGDISPAMQVKLLRALQQREFERVGGGSTVQVDVRVIAATHRDLAAEVAAGRFREDLYYRLNVVSITVPPLRQRKEELAPLTRHFVHRFSEAYRKHVAAVEPAALEALRAYDWPGNVRELENAIERAVVLCPGDTVRVEDLPPALSARRSSSGIIPGPMVPGASLYEIERYAILKTLAATHGSTSRAAEMLGISVRKVQYRLKEYAQAAATTVVPMSRDD